MVHLYKIPLYEKPLAYISKRLKQINSPRTVAVVPSNRNLRRLAAIGEWELDLQTVSEFTRRANLYNGVLLPKELRDYHLYKAAASLSKDEKITIMSAGADHQLGSYLSFVQQSSSLLPFFRELVAEQIDVEYLRKASMYQDYEQQIMVLSTLWDKYRLSVHEAGYMDEWECYSKPSLDHSYLRRYDNYIFLISGYLSNYELLQLYMISMNCNLEIYFNYTGDVHHQAGKLHEVFGTGIKSADDDFLLGWRASGNMPLGDGFLEAELALTNNPEYLSKSALNAGGQPVNVQVVPCSSQLAQYDLITSRICHANFVEGIDFSDMAVILPAAGMDSWFLHSDSYGLYNVSAGRPLSSYPFFELLNRLINMLVNMKSDLILLEDLEIMLAHPYFTADLDVDRLPGFIDKLKNEGRLYIDASILPKLNIPLLSLIYNILLPFTAGWYRYTGMLKSVSKLLESFKNKADTVNALLEREAVDWALDELDKMKLLYKDIDEEMPGIEILRKITGDLSSVKVPVQKGRVRVIGLLESRNMDYKAVFVPDMNSEVFPADQGKDLFLNSELRRDLALPTIADRQELQKGYLYQLIARAKYVCISYTDSEETQPSIFINEILGDAGYKHTKDKISPYTPDGSTVIPMFFSVKSVDKDDIIKDYELSESLKSYTYSATSINCFVKCQLQFYYRYIKRMERPVKAIGAAGPLEIGSILHTIIESAYKMGVLPSSVEYMDTLYRLFNNEIDKYDYYRYNAIGRYEADALKSTFTKMVAQERARLEGGARIAEAEKKIHGVFNGIKITGRVDRIDETDNGYDIIDYKYRTLEMASKNYRFDADNMDCQLPVYAIVAKQQKGSHPDELLWFDLKGGKGFVPGFYIENIDYFADDLLNAFNILFMEGTSLTGACSERICGYCEYVSICPKVLI